MIMYKIVLLLKKKHDINKTTILRIKDILV